MTQNPALSIPKRHRTALIRLLELSPDRLDAFVTSIKRVTPEASVYGLAVRLSELNETLDFDDIHDILEMFISLQRFRAARELSVAKLVDGFISAAREEASRGIPQKENWKELKDGLKAVFAIDGPLAITAKASEVALERERTFCPSASRMVTDVRPVFLTGANAPPHAAIIQHTLKISYHTLADKGDVFDFYVTINEKDVDALLMLLLRGKTKEQSLRKLMKKTGIQMMASEEDSEWSTH